jgi:uncharacterized membrane protein
LVTTVTPEDYPRIPRDFVTLDSLDSATVVSAQHFAAFYLLSRGIIKTVLIVGLLRERVHGRGRA